MKQGLYQLFLFIFDKDRLILIPLFIFSAQLIYGQTFIGAGSGFHVPGTQDQKFKKFGANGKLEETYLAKDVDGQTTTFNSLSVNKIFISHKKNKTGARVELMSWEFTSNTDDFSMAQIPLTGYVKQDRLGIFGTILRYYSLKQEGHTSGKLSPLNYFIGVGGGMILTDNDPGSYVWSPGFQVVNGFMAKLDKKIHALLEIRYLLSKDADNYPSKAGWFVDTSGSPTFFRFHPHFDTRFIVCQIELGFKL